MANEQLSERAEYALRNNPFKGVPNKIWKCLMLGENDAGEAGHEIFFDWPYRIQGEGQLHGGRAIYLEINAQHVQGSLTVTLGLDGRTLDIESRYEARDLVSPVEGGGIIEKYRSITPTDVTMMVDRIAKRVKNANNQLLQEELEMKGGTRLEATPNFSLSM